MITLKHIASAPNCDFARLVGLAPARRGEPGYWQHHDRDGDGVACEPWRPRRGEVPQRTAGMTKSD
ncbi:excalibur calcium-binding domain-containing protein [Bradyrhizobium yuanmingense]|uniref:excalibur calcium-binding domain-containing protein n=1 Tax=Bradyrhizobium yuanmingense TaxID=108015 RepID=UPI0023B9CFA4|nr:excalibur calcium-binding domain-containing protein [Bradyrhizobium yuanmingense]MDF0493124.1 excalibur calcium-binding domain-containing protein [Bradyrhizobium yuanmingense]